MAACIVDQDSRELAEALSCFVQKLRSYRVLRESRSQTANPVCEGRSLRALLFHRSRNWRNAERLYRASTRIAR
jgi:hypothetical protein